MVISTNYVQNEDSGLKSAHESAGSTEPGNDLSAASLTFCGTPINMPNFTCQQPLDDQFSIAGFLESAIENLNPIDCRDGSDIYQCSQLLEFENKLLESDLRPLPCDIEPGCEISLINLAALNIADKSYLSIVNQKEICMPQTSSNSNNKEDLDRQVYGNTVPFKKRPISTDITNSTEASTNKDDQVEKKESRPKAALSLNELQLQRIAKFAAHRKKKLRFGTSETANNNMTTATQASEHSTVDAHDTNFSEAEPRSSLQSLKIQQPQTKIDCTAVGAGHVSTQANISVSHSSLGFPSSAYIPECSKFTSSRIGTIPTTDILPSINTDTGVWDEQMIRLMDESVVIAKASQQSPPETMIPLHPVFFFHVFVSSPVERDVHQYIVNNIPPPQPARRLFPSLFVLN